MIDIYIACPYSHPVAQVREARFGAVNRVTAQLMKKGFVVFSPISHTHPIAVAGDLPKGWDYWEHFDRVFLSMSRKLYILTLDGWKESEGVQGEIEIAKELNLPIYEVDEDTLQAALR
jgi:hypothetical protein